MYGKQSLTMNEVKSILNFKELQKKEHSIETAKEGFSVRERT